MCVIISVKTNTSFMKLAVTHRSINVIVLLLTGGGGGGGDEGGGGGGGGGGESLTAAAAAIDLQAAAVTDILF